MGQMNAMVELDECRDEISGGRYPPRLHVGKSNGGGGGDMDEVLKRLGAVETAVSETKVQVDAIAATLPHLATKDDVTAVRVEISGVRVEVAEVRTQVAGIAAVMPHLATKADLTAVRVEVAEFGTKLIKWLIATGIATAGLVVTLVITIEKFIH
jgi:hypothetical protein